ncbi:hypothetical protein BBJ28_00004855 [Nothophytophthora sp. Chile5]|nr:hypothetical protein BBJ28_00004855 [Nothophytophthora sp. Chile5]
MRLLMCYCLVQRARSAVSVKEKKKSVKQNQPEPKTEAEVDVWTSTQLQSLTDAKMKIPTTASNFWAQVQDEKSDEALSRFKSPPVSRKSSNKPAKRVATAANAAAEIKIARAGSNKFKKQYEKKHVDDLFEMSTPSKDELPESVEFDSLKSPGAELTTPSRSFNDDDSDNDDDMPGMLKKLSSRRRDDVDSYVLGINRQHVAGGGVMAGGKVRRLTAPVTPVPTLKAKKKVAKKKAVHLVEECGSHYLEGVVSPGGTTHVRVEKDGSSSEDEEEDDYRSSGAESSCDFD